ncbi:MAG TPA: hypothetical protein VHX49_00190 [Candidatus Acidoferrales bacterium]|jgi:hypothetical protein|nr:hypothetical protein [Candidatus Acidoferrales bacterium]
MTPKTTGTTMQPPSKPLVSAAGGPADLAAQWAEARAVYPIYAALATQFNLALLPYPAGEVPPARPTRSVFDNVLQWLAKVDEHVLAYQIRQVPSEILNASEEALRSLIHRQLRKTDKTDADRDKIDLLLVQYFAMCAPEQLYSKDITLDDVAEVLRPVLAEADPTPLEWCEPLETILAKVASCHSLRDLMEAGLVEQGRMLKDSAGCMFYDPAALVAFCRFSFLVRRAFIRMLHADLQAVRETINSLDKLGVKTIDCRRAGFSAAETTIQLRFFCENWRQPFQKDYTENSVGHAFEQLLALRADLEDALERAQKPAKKAPVSASKSTATAAPPTHEDVSAAAPTMFEGFFADESTGSTEAEPESEPEPAPQAAAQPAPQNHQPPTVAAAQKPAAAEPAAKRVPPAKPEVKAPATPVVVPPPSFEPMDADKCLEAIWEQLIAAPPSRGRSMSTVVLQDTKVLLSSWEVAAFVSEDSPESEDLRRAVVARALLAVASDRRKRSGDETALNAALALARNEVSYFHGRVEQAKRSKNTEAAVNLGISTKRLLSFMEEAEKLKS